jgi:hypothetical protein
MVGQGSGVIVNIGSISANIVNRPGAVLAAWAAAGT